MVVAISFINTRTYADERIQEVSDTLLEMITTSKQEKRSAHLPAISVQRQVNGQVGDVGFAGSICLGRELGSIL